jgi:dihydroorotate dehydrogenase
MCEKFNYTYTIIGVGGVSSPEDFQEYRKAGADIVMSATGAMWNPYLAEEIKKSLNLKII